MKICNKEGHRTDDYGCLDCFIEQANQKVMDSIWNNEEDKFWDEY